MKKETINNIVLNILNNHKKRNNAILFKDILRDSKLKGVTQGQVREAIRELRLKKYPISSRPNVGYYIEANEMKGCRIWIENLRIAKLISPMTPESMKWV